MLKRMIQSSDGTAVFHIGRTLKFIYKFRHFRIIRTVGRGDRYGFPFIGSYRIGIGIHYDIESSDLVCSHTGLDDQDIVDLARFFKIGMRMTADDDIDPQIRI